MDTGCKDAFGGNGVCIDVKGDMTKFDLDLSAGHDPKPDLCKHAWDKDCCSCFKLNNVDDKQCKNDMCEERGGECFMPKELPTFGYQPTQFYCNKKLGCKCYMPTCENDECEEQGGKCVMPTSQFPQMSAIPQNPFLQYQFPQNSLFSQNLFPQDEFKTQDIISGFTDISSAWILQTYVIG